MVSTESLAARALSQTAGVGAPTVTIDLAGALAVAERCGRYEAVLWEIGHLLVEHANNPGEGLRQINLVGRNMLNRSDWGA